MMKFYLLLSFLFLAPITYGQTGSLCVNLDFTSDTASYNTEIRITRNDSLVKERKYIQAGFICFDNLDTGQYSVSVKKPNYVGLTYDEIRVDSGEKTVIQCYMQEPYLTKEYNGNDDDDYTPGSYSMALSLQYFNRDLFQTNDLVRKVFSYGFKSIMIEYPFSKRVGVGLSIGSSISNCLIEKNIINKFSEPVDKEKYFYWKAMFAPTVRIILGKTTRPEKHFIDIAANYNLPIMFRYVGVKGDQKMSYRSIHQYTDFSLLMRLGIAHWLAVTTEYRLADFIDEGYPEMPKFQVGIDLIISEH